VSRAITAKTVSGFDLDRDTLRGDAKAPVA
jgi:hypothetical protein